MRSEKEFKNTKHCHICEEQLLDKSRDIDHLQKIQGMLKILYLPKYRPTKKLFKKQNYYNDKPTETVEKTKHIYCYIYRKIMMFLLEIIVLLLEDSDGQHNRIVI